MMCFALPGKWLGPGASGFCEAPEPGVASTPLSASKPARPRRPRPVPVRRSSSRRVIGRTDGEDDEFIVAGSPEIKFLVGIPSPQAWADNVGTNLWKEPIQIPSG